MDLTPELLKADRAHIMASLTTAGVGTTATRNDTAVEFECLRTRRLSARRVHDAGWDTVYEFSIRGKYEDINDIQSQTVTVTVDGEEYKVLEVDNKESHTWTMLHLGDVYGGRER